MSLSDNDTEQFQPFDVASLETFEKVPDSHSDGRVPDLDRFKTLFEKTEFKSEESTGFETLYKDQPEEKDTVFKPLIENEETSGENVGEKNGKPDAQQSEEPPEPEETAEEKGFREGFENGYAEGLTQSQEQGFKEGFEKAETEGFKEGEEKGFKKGEAAGRQEGLKTGGEQADRETREKAEIILQSLESTLQDVGNLIPSLVAKYETRIVGLIQQIAEKAVFATVEMDDEVIKPMVLDAINSLVEPEQVNLSVNDDDFEYIEMIKDDFFQEVESLEQISVKSDPTIPRGGCKIETNTASIETDPQKRLNAIFEAIKNRSTM